MKNNIKKIGVIIIISLFSLALSKAEAQEIKKETVNTSIAISVKGVKKINDIKIDTYYKDQFIKKMFIKTKYSKKYIIC